MGCIEGIGALGGFQGMSPVLWALQETCARSWRPSGCPYKEDYIKAAYTLLSLSKENPSNLLVFLVCMRASIILSP